MQNKLHKRILVNFVRKLFSYVGISIQRYKPMANKSPQIGSPNSKHYLSISKLGLSHQQLREIDYFRTDRYYWINEYRWRLALQTGLTFQGQRIFEPGAGIGDQTAWLLQQGAREVIVSEGRQSNLSVIEKRFKNDSRVKCLLLDLEKILDNPEFQIKADLVFCWGVYYHIYDPIPSFPILNKFAEIAPILIMDYQESQTGENWLEYYGYDNVSASLGYKSFRQTKETITRGVLSAFGHCYFPKENMCWNDPSTPSAPRRIVVGSKKPLDLQGIIDA